MKRDEIRPVSAARSSSSQPNRSTVVLPITSGGNFARTAGFAVTITGAATRTTSEVRCDQPGGITAGHVQDRDGLFEQRLPAPGFGLPPDIIALRTLVRPGVRLIVPCLLLFVVVLFPRVMLALMWLFSTYLERAFHGGLSMPLLGFIFLPLTTIVYAWEINNHMPTAGINLLWLLIAVIIDLGGLGGGAHRQSKR